MKKIKCRHEDERDFLYWKIVLFVSIPLSTLFLVILVCCFRRIRSRRIQPPAPPVPLQPDVEPAEEELAEAEPAEEEPAEEEPAEVEPVEEEPAV